MDLLGLLGYPFLLSALYKNANKYFLSELGPEFDRSQSECAGVGKLPQARD